MLELSKRLSLIADFVNEGSSVCDVGTDHGYLPAFLYLSGKCKSVTATDINEKPLQSARKNLDRLNANGVRLILCDGLSGVEQEDIDTVIIAGMGGEVISGIIDRCAFVHSDKVSLILQPTTAAKELRIFLSKNGFCVEKEQAIKENDKIYSVMLVRYTGEEYTVLETQAVIGKLKPDSADSIAYIKKQFRIAQKCAEQLKMAENKKEEYNYYFKLSEELKDTLGG